MLLPLFSEQKKNPNNVQKAITGCLKNGVRDSQPSQLGSVTKRSLYILLSMGFLTLLPAAQSQPCCRKVIPGCFCFGHQGNRLLSSNQLQVQSLGAGRGAAQTILRARSGGDAPAENTTLALSPWTKLARPATRDKQAAFQ